MIRLWFVAVLSLGLAAALPAAHAQVSTRSYAPENLRQLSVPDRIRVLETEYREISNGRQLPRDQRDFYLAQIDSGWTFSRIKSDMAQSLGGRPGGGWDNGGDGDHGNGWGDRQVRCDSNKRRYHECEADFRGRARLSRQISRAECVEEQTWGQRPGVIWVKDGCRAEFVDSGGGWGGGWNRPPNDYNITCSSKDQGYTTCAWNSRYGRPVLIEQLSRGHCIEGRTWGYRGETIWVDQGCRGRFGVRR
jgi:hypothetical protein